VAHAHRFNKAVVIAKLASNNSSPERSSKHKRRPITKEVHCAATPPLVCFGRTI
jgi:hypothetical protein